MTLGEVVTYFETQEPRGEYVLVVEGSTETAKNDSFWIDIDIPTHVAHYMEGGMSKMDAIKQAAKDRGVPKNEVYQQML